MAELSFQRMCYRQSREYYNEALVLDKKLGSEAKITRDQLGLAKCLVELRQYQNALNILNTEEKKLVGMEMFSHRPVKSTNPNLITIWNLQRKAYLMLGNFTQVYALNKQISKFSQI